MNGIKATDLCQHCFREFADHNYVKDSIDKYQCPQPHVETGYGLFHGGDPRKFTPDHELCSAAEIEAWKTACEQWNAAERTGQTLDPLPCLSGPFTDEYGKIIGHISRSQFGIGVYSIESESFFEKLDHDNESY